MSVLAQFRATPESVARMRRDVLFEHDDNVKRYSSFWALMILSGAIATAGILTESIPALIGAMIISPFVTPMAGLMLALVLTQRVNVIRSVGLLVGGAAAAVALGYLLGLFVDAEISAATNPVVADRVTPDVFDLVVGLFTGIVAAVALVREDISNSVPGVAIAVTLVPALAVAGLVIESGEYRQGLDALVLFGANAVATLFAGTFTMALAGVRKSWPPSEDNDDEGPRAGDSRPVSQVVAAAVVAVVLVAPLSLSVWHLGRESSTQDAIENIARDWAESHGVEFTDLSPTGALVTVTFEGSPPFPPLSDLEAQLIAQNIEPSTVEVRLVPVTTLRLSDH